MRERFSAAAETHAFTEVVTTLFAIVTVVTHDASLDGYTLSWNEVFDASTYCGDDTGCLVTQDERGLDSKVAIPTTEVIVNYWGVSE